MARSSRWPDTPSDVSSYGSSAGGDAPSPVHFRPAVGGLNPRRLVYSVTARRNESVCLRCISTTRGHAVPARPALVARPIGGHTSCAQPGTGAATQRPPARGRRPHLGGVDDTESATRRTTARLAAPRVRESFHSGCMRHTRTTWRSTQPGFVGRARSTRGGRPRDAEEQRRCYPSRRRRFVAARLFDCPSGAAHGSRSWQAPTWRGDGGRKVTHAGQTAPSVAQPLQPGSDVDRGAVG